MSNVQYSINFAIYTHNEKARTFHMRSEKKKQILFFRALYSIRIVKGHCTLSCLCNKYTLAKYVQYESCVFLATHINNLLQFIWYAMILFYESVRFMVLSVISLRKESV